MSLLRIFLLVCYLAATLTYAAPRNKNRITPWHVNFTQPNLALGPLVAQWKEGVSKVNPEEMGSYYEGDIMMPKTPFPITRNGVNYASMQWVGGIVPYVIASTIDATQLSIINQAISTIQNNTCVKFIPRTTEVDYVYIQNQNSGCWSYIGRKGGMQELNLQTQGCHIVGIAIHELMHALGFFHEHTRDDRDLHVNIVRANIDPAKMNNFDIWPYSKNTYEVGYDYSSILHYSAYAFSINGQATIVPLVSGVSIGQRTYMTVGDITRIKGMYKCL